jgi:DnaD/phage-associated family protein
MTFKGFSEDNLTQIRIPEQFFRQVLFEIDDLNELKLTLYIFWRLERMESPIHYILFSDLMGDSRLVQSLGSASNTSVTNLEECLHKAVLRGTLLQANLIQEDGEDKIICLNSPKGRAVIEAVNCGDWKSIAGSVPPVDFYPDHPNIFKLYESNIGPLTPMIADALRDAESTYQADWIEDAFQIAVERNKRSWHYIEAILHRWQEGGRDDRKDKQNRRDTEEARRRYGEWEK